MNWDCESPGVGAAGEVEFACDWLNFSRYRADPNSVMWSGSMVAGCEPATQPWSLGQGRWPDGAIETRGSPQRVPALLYRESVAKRDAVELFAVDDGRDSIMVGASASRDAGRGWDSGGLANSDDDPSEEKCTKRLRQSSTRAVSREWFATRVCGCGLLESGWSKDGNDAVGEVESIARGAVARRCDAESKGRRKRRRRRRRRRRWDRSKLFDARCRKKRRRGGVGSDRRTRRVGTENEDLLGSACFGRVGAG